MTFNLSLAIGLHYFALYLVKVRVIMQMVLELLAIKLAFLHVR